MHVRTTLPISRESAVMFNRSKFSCLSHLFVTSLTIVLGSAATTAMAQSSATRSPSADEQATSTMRIEEASDHSGWSIYDGDELVAGYRFDSNGKPIVYPVIGPGGQEMTRRYPMDDALPSEKEDHPHHRSLWMTHGEVNGFDFWADEKNEGDTLHREGTASVNDQGAAVIETQNDWIAPDGKRVLSDTRRIAFYTSGGRRLIDFDIVLKASDGDVNFGDTKEGSFGMRVPGTMKVDAKLGGVITTSKGDSDQAAWGKRAAWVDYSGPVAASKSADKSEATQTVGITIHNHPSSFGFPCAWHVRTYGLFAANPFGVHDFVGGEKTKGVELKSGEELRLGYRIVLHDGGLDKVAADQDQAKFASEKRPL